MKSVLPEKISQKKHLSHTPRTKASVPCPSARRKTGCNGGLIQFDRVQTEIYCSQCAYTAPTPAKWQGPDAEGQWVGQLERIARQDEKSAVLDGLKPHDVELLIGLAEEISKGFGYLPSYDPFSGHYRSKREYLEYVGHFLDIGKILSLRKQCLESKRRSPFPDDSFFAQNVIEQGAPGIATDKQRIVSFGRLVRQSLERVLNPRKKEIRVANKRTRFNPQECGGVESCIIMSRYLSGIHHLPSLAQMLTYRARITYPKSRYKNAVDWYVNSKQGFTSHVYKVRERAKRKGWSNVISPEFWKSYQK